MFDNYYYCDDGGSFFVAVRDSGVSPSTVIASQKYVYSYHCWSVCLDI
jgi:hypothetical protein